MSRARRFFGTFLGQVFLWSVIVIASLYIAFQLGVDPNAAGASMSEGASSVRGYRWFIALARWCIWAVVWWQWDAIGNRLVSDDAPNAVERRAYWASRRKVYMGGIVIIEIAIVISFLVG
ncbi:MAG: hypothetical protein AAGA91_18825 [Pseudomonadota bacterium]